MLYIGQKQRIVQRDERHDLRIGVSTKLTIVKWLAVHVAPLGNMRSYKSRGPETHPVVVACLGVLLVVGTAHLHKYSTVGQHYISCHLPGICDFAGKGCSRSDTFVALRSCSHLMGEIQ